MSNVKNLNRRTTDITPENSKQYTGLLVRRQGIADEMGEGEHIPLAHLPPVVQALVAAGPAVGDTNTTYNIVTDATGAMFLEGSDGSSTLIAAAPVAEPTGALTCDAGTGTLHAVMSDNTTLDTGIICPEADTDTDTWLKPQAPVTNADGSVSTTFDLVDASGAVIAANAWTDVQPAPSSTSVVVNADGSFSLLNSMGTVLGSWQPAAATPTGTMTCNVATGNLESVMTSGPNVDTGITCPPKGQSLKPKAPTTDATTGVVTTCFDLVDDSGTVITANAWCHESSCKFSSVLSLREVAPCTWEKVSYWQGSGYKSAASSPKVNVAQGGFVILDTITLPHEGVWEVGATVAFTSAQALAADPFDKEEFQYYGFRYNGTVYYSFPDAPDTFFRRCSFSDRIPITAANGLVIDIVAYQTQEPTLELTTREKNATWTGVL